ncbi:MAG: DUF255 domain-containing protein [Hydrogenimonas sp.]|nr:DUF255 domain-containing protein [Hydrogenimonas sp.]
MKRTVITAIFLATSLFAQIEWEGSYESALKRAKEQGKPMLILVVSEHCRWCHKLEEETLADPNVENFINRRFVPLLLDREKDSYPSFIKARAVPTTIYLTPDEKMLIKPVEGYWDPLDYMSDLKLAVRVFKRAQALGR